MDQVLSLVGHHTQHQHTKNFLLENLDIAFYCLGNLLPILRQFLLHPYIQPFSTICHSLLCQMPSSDPQKFIKLKVYYRERLKPSEINQTRQLLLIYYV